LFSGTSGANWTDSSNWNNPSSPEVNSEEEKTWFCSLYGVQKVTRVPATIPGDTLVNLITEINLSHNNLGNILNNDGSKMLSDFFYCLPGLVKLNISHNELSGFIPRSIDAAKASLTHLRLGFNKFRGCIPHEIFNCTALTVLDLCYNSFEGEVPSYIGCLRQLEILFLFGNTGLKGSIPQTFSRLSNLTQCYLFRCSFSGPLPRFTSTRLSELLLHDNHFSGAIPSDLSNCSALITLRLDDNELEGPIPESLKLLENLRYLYVVRGNSKLTGVDTVNSLLPHCTAIK